MNMPRAGSTASETARPESEQPVVLACRHTDATDALMRGLLKLPEVPLRVVENNDVVRMFAGMHQGEYDVSEMSLAEFIYYRSREVADFIGIPVFPSGIFRHRHIYYNASSGISSPELLNGKKIGVSPLGSDRLRLDPRHAC